MSWKVRHQGSPRSIEGLTLSEVIEGLQEGQWDPTDEVMGPDDGQWQSIENHPQFAEIALGIEPPLVKPHEDETRLDMNPLIDVALVLLIFFILTTSYAILQRVIDLPGTSAQDVNRPLQRTQSEVKALMIKVVIRKAENGQVVIKVEDEPVEERHLRATLARFVKDKRKTDLLIDAKGVDIGTVIRVQDAAKGAGITMVYYPNRQAAERQQDGSAGRD
jgi:biopolymer transport protein ExbD